MSQSIIQELPNAIHISDCLLVIAKLDYQMQLDQLQVNKYCYLIDAFTLHYYQKPVFYNNVEVWQYGPIIPEIYSAYKVYGDKPITHLEICGTDLNDTDNINKRYENLIKIIGDDIAGIISGVIKEYGKFSGSQLVTMTYGKHTPWKKAYKPGHNKIITSDIIQKFYKNLKPGDMGR